ncbi:hypothetical protein BGW36DRAFT_421124 [Talaromyces proteolyticus]|uniref:Uncharacterized protein n=1 Tax=Talaromyces proteolyticus TaxID=1131652 RepID=A0AAD4KHQ7_9EURO|nr:uncharacterized protein BGW36DRAFT_421124 [Talaromyces proteolyticus]KAH8688735.1 hypothetical protein BGW36DRAFT_421124 [Talaromyces proteolyticus]
MNVRDLNRMVYKNEGYLYSYIYLAIEWLEPIVRKITPLPSCLDLNGKTAVVTGSSAGMGLKVARLLLKLKISTLILAVRNVPKGGACNIGLQKFNSDARITVLKLDMDDYESVQTFAKGLPRGTPVVNIVSLNAGIGLLKLERSSSGHDRAIQVNYHSNILLVAELLPHLQASAIKSGSPTRITWVGSRSHHLTNFEKKAPIKPEEVIFEHIDSEEFFFPFQRHGDSKLLCAMFMDGKSIRARPVEVGGWIILNAALVAGAESHGRFLGDKEIIEPSQYIQSLAGREVQKKLGLESIAEVVKLTPLPAELSAQE